MAPIRLHLAFNSTSSALTICDTKRDEKPKLVSQNARYSHDHAEVQYVHPVSAVFGKVRNVGGLAPLGLAKLKGSLVSHDHVTNPLQR